MKKLNNLFLLLMLLLFLNACTTENLETKGIEINQLISEMQNRKITAKDNAIFADIKYDSKSGHILNYEILEKEFDLIVLPFGSGYSVNSRADKYKVSCSVNVYKDIEGKKTGERNCDGRSAGNTIKKCLDAGRCAEICEATLIWVKDANSPGEDVLFVTPDSH